MDQHSSAAPGPAPAPAGPGPGGTRPVGVVQWLAARSLRARLIAGLVGLLALACATVGVVTYTHLHSVLLNQLDAELATASNRYGDCVHDQGPPPGPAG